MGMQTIDFSKGSLLFSLHICQQHLLNVLSKKFLAVTYGCTEYRVLHKYPCMSTPRMAAVV